MNTTGIKRWWHSLTIWVGNTCTVTGAAIQKMDTDTQHTLAQYFGHYGGAVLAGLGILITLLRLKSGTAIAGTPAAKAITDQ